MTAEAEVIIGEVRAVKISPAHLNVQDDGQLTVKIVNEKNRVKNCPCGTSTHSRQFCHSFLELKMV